MVIQNLTRRGAAQKQPGVAEDVQAVVDFENESSHVRIMDPTPVTLPTLVWSLCPPAELCQNALSPVSPHVRMPRMLSNNWHAQNYDVERRHSRSVVKWTAPSKHLAALRCICAMQHVGNHIFWGRI